MIIFIGQATEESLFAGYEDTDNFDVEASLGRFECLLEEVLADIFPEATIHFSSLVPGYHVFEEEDPIVVESVQEQVQRIAEELFEEGNWYVEKAGEHLC